MSAKLQKPANPALRDALSFNIAGEERLLQNTSEEALLHASSHQNDSGRTLLEILLALFAIRILLQSRTRADNGEKHFIHFPEKVGPISVSPLPHTDDPRSTRQQVDELVDEWTPELLSAPLTPEEQSDLASSADVHWNFDRDIADFLGTEASILYSQGFSTISCVISAFAKRGDIIFDHDDLKNLKDVLRSVEKERRKRRGPLTRRFIVTEGIVKKDGAMVDLPKLIELKHKYKYFLILDESISFGTVERTGCGLTELYNVPATQIDMIIGSVASGLNSSGGFCTGSRIIVDHQHINSTSFVFSAEVPALLEVSASEGINILRNTPSILSTLQENACAIRAVLDRRKTNALRRTPPRQSSTSTCGVWTTRARLLRGQELVEARPSMRLAVTAALSRKECERAAGVIKAAVAKMLTKRK
ncbi:serine palmitoyltransferase [Lactarius vividus]|nr:serine palmitoyltransferase [Lactarius vividus]